MENTLFTGIKLLTLKTLIYDGTNEMKPLVTEFVTQVTEFVT
jgi:hypothetical protein